MTATLASKTTRGDHMDHHLELGRDCAAVASGMSA